MPREVLDTIAEFHSLLTGLGISPDAAWWGIYSTLGAALLAVTTYTGRLSGWAAKKSALLALGAVLLALRGGWMAAYLAGRGLAHPFRRKPLSDVGRAVLASLDGPSLKHDEYAVFNQQVRVVTTTSDAGKVLLVRSNLIDLDVTRQLNRADRKAILARARRYKANLEASDQLRERDNLLRKLTPPPPPLPEPDADYFSISIDDIVPDEPAPTPPARQPVLPLPPSPAPEYRGGPFGTPRAS